MSSADFGKKLRRARLDRKKRFPDLQTETKIQADYLRKLENGQFDFFPEPIIRGFVKSYAQALGLDPDHLIKLYEQARSGSQSHAKPSVIKEVKSETKPASERPVVPPATKGPKEEFVRPKEETTFRRTETPTSGRRYDDPVVKNDVADLRKPSALPAAGRSRPGWLAAHRGEVTLGSMVLLIIFAIVIVYVRYGSDDLAEQQQPVEKISVFEARQQNIDSATTAKPEIEPIRVPEKVKLRIVAAETTWVRMIRDEVDTSEYIFRPGLDRFFEADNKIEVRLGRADGLIFWVNSDSVGKLGSAAEIVSRLVITEQGITERRVRPPTSPAPVPVQ